MDEQNFTVVKQDQSDAPPVETLDTPAKPTPKATKRAVRVLNARAYTTKPYILVVSVSDESEAWLLPKDSIPANALEFKVGQDVLDAAPRPQELLDKLEDLIPSALDIQVALWRYGVVEKEDFINHSALARALAKVAISQTVLSKIGRGN
jgi:hypothetical protein